MIVNNENLQFIFVQGDLRFQQGLTQGEPTFYNRICSVVPSSTRENHYGFIDRIDGLREWLSERVVDNIRTREYTLKNKTFEKTLGLDREDIEDDQLGIFNMSLDMLSFQVRVFPDAKLVTPLLQNGEDAGSVGYDGVSFFNANHPVDLDDTGKGVYSNYDSTGVALTAANYALKRAQIRSLKGPDGTPLGVTPNVLMVPPALESRGRQILHDDFIAPASAVGQNAASYTQTNTLKGTAELVINPFLAGEDTTWYLLNTTFPIRPFIFQQREGFKYTYLTSPSDPNVFHLKKFLYGVDGRCNAGYALPFLAYKGVA